MTGSGTAGGLVTAREATIFRRLPTLGDLEVLHATYITQTFPRHTHEQFAIGINAVDLALAPALAEDGTRLGDDLLVNLTDAEGEFVIFGYAESEGGGAWDLDEVARVFGIAPDARVWDVTALDEFERDLAGAGGPLTGPRARGPCRCGGVPSGAAASLRLHPGSRFRRCVGRGSLPQRTPSCTKRRQGRWGRRC